MISLKRCNYITGNVGDVVYATNSIVKFLELDGRNPLLFVPDKETRTNLHNFMSNYVSFNNYDEFVEKLTNSSILFRVDLLIFDFYNLNINKSNVNVYKNIIEDLNIDYIILAQEYNYRSNENVNDFYVRREYKDNYKSDIFITDKINNWTSTLDLMSVSYIRDKKIDKLFGNE